MLKKIISLMMAICFMLTITPIQAQECSKIRNIDEYSYIDDKGYRHEFFDTEGNRIKINELQKENKETNIPADLLAVIGPYYDEVKIVSASNVNGTRRKVTADLAGPGTISYGESVTTTATFSVNLGASILSRIFSKVKIEVNASVALSSSTSTSFNYTFTVPSGKTGAIYFTPYLVSVNTYYYDNEGVRTTILARFPKKTSAGVTDGIYELVTH